MAAKSAGSTKSGSSKSKRSWPKKSVLSEEGEEKCGGKAKSSSTPPWLKPSSGEAPGPDMVGFDLTSPEDLIKKMEEIDLTEEETEELLKKAYAINRQLKEAATGQRVERASAPLGTRLSSGDRPRSRGKIDAGVIPGGRQTSLSSGAYSRGSMPSPTSSQSSSKYTSLHGAQTAYNIKPHAPPSGKRKKQPVKLQQT